MDQTLEMMQSTWEEVPGLKALLSMEMRPYWFPGDFFPPHLEVLEAVRYPLWRKAAKLGFVRQSYARLAKTCGFEIEVDSKR